MKKKSFVLILLFMSFSTSVWAFSCPSLMQKIDKAFASANINENRLETIEFLREKGEHFHTSGDHKASEITLNAAIDLL